jgi:hypothetical protein
MILIRDTVLLFGEENKKNVICIWAAADVTMLHEQASISVVIHQHPKLKSDTVFKTNEGVSPLSTPLEIIRLLGRGGEVASLMPMT